MLYLCSKFFVTEGTKGSNNSATLTLLMKRSVDPRTYSFG